MQYQINIPGTAVFSHYASARRWYAPLDLTKVNNSEIDRVTEMGKKKKKKKIFLLHLNVKELLQIAGYYTRFKGLAEFGQNLITFQAKYFHFTN